jgi:hypothetical protein
MAYSVDEVVSVSPSVDADSSPRINIEALYRLIRRSAGPDGAPRRLSVRSAAEISLAMSPVE